MSLTIEYAQDDITQASDGDASTQSLGSLTTTEVYQMQPGSSSQENVCTALSLSVITGHGVLVEMQTVDEVRVPTLEKYLTGVENYFSVNT